MPPRPSRLSDYPFVVVRLSCSYYPRRGQYRLARLAERYGADIGIEHMLGLLAGDCPWHGRKQRKYVPTCGIYLPDLEGAPRPPDLPPALGRLVAIEGGKKKIG
ncbi:hypothetical protein GCM10007989_00320 [Devosia pacifica]|uniref:Uncharacterized protein n=1 Tax=Devosia pacifica TaxID=1335967 RepID=A0A918VMB3_9HYPH|nr:hypothetical protein GCM10007989_00320 [Devosia pacifica]